MQRAQFGKTNLFSNGKNLKNKIQTQHLGLNVNYSYYFKFYCAVVGNIKLQQVITTPAGAQLTPRRLLSIKDKSKNVVFLQGGKKILRIYE